MKIVNETQYSTADLKRFFSAGLAAMGAEPGTTVKVEYGKHFAQDYKHGFGGTHARYSSPFVRMVVPRDLPLHLPLAARIFEHEILHNLGLRHGDMDERGTAKWIWFSDIAPEWSKELTIRAHEAKPSPSPADRVAFREAHAKKMAERWEKKLAVAKRQAKKWQKKVRYYETREPVAATTAARPKPPTIPPAPEGIIRVGMNGQAWNNLEEALTYGNGWEYRIEESRKPESSDEELAKLAEDWQSQERAHLRWLDVKREQAAEVCSTLQHFMRHNDAQLNPRDAGVDRTLERIIEKLAVTQG
jgi:hypothetical protein